VKLLDLPEQAEPTEALAVGVIPGAAIECVPIDGRAVRNACDRAINDVVSHVA
jgi:hypothetical protein